MEIGAFGEWLSSLLGRVGLSKVTVAVLMSSPLQGSHQDTHPGEAPPCWCWCGFMLLPSLPPLFPSERSQDSTAVALSDSSSTQDFFNEPASSLEGSRKLYVEKKLPVPSIQVGPTGKDLQGPTEERGMKT